MLTKTLGNRNKIDRQTEQYKLFSAFSSRKSGAEARCRQRKRIEDDDK